MEAQFLTDLEMATSPARLLPYREATSSDREAIVSYLYNLALSEALYSPLCCLEISLRNSLDRALRTRLDSDEWFDRSDLFSPNQRKDILTAKRRALPVHAPAEAELVPGKVVAELNFGFWTSLLSSTYEDALWRSDRAQLLKEVFPFIPRRLRQRNTIYARYNRLRELRNRVFHHESIWNRPTLQQDHRDVQDAIGWVNPSMNRALLLVDRFDTVYQDGRSHIEDALRLEFGSD